MSKSSNVLLMAVLALSYVVFFFIFMPLTLSIEQPRWWYEILGQSAFSAVAWMQLAHSLGMAIAAVPAGLVIARFLPFAKYRLSVLVSTGLTLVIAYALYQGLSSVGIPNSRAIQISHMLDVVKPAPTMICVVLLFVLLFQIYTPKKLIASGSEAHN